MIPKNKNRNLTTKGLQGSFFNTQKIGGNDK